MGTVRSERTVCKVDRPFVSTRRKRSGRGQRVIMVMIRIQRGQFQRSLGMLDRKLSFILESVQRLCVPKTLSELMT